MLKKGKSDNIKEEEWREEYKKRYDVFLKFSKKLYDLLTDILEKNSIDYYLIEYRVKTEDSFIKKVYSPSYTYINPITEMIDLVGVRLVLYSLYDVDKVIPLIESLFEMNDKVDLDKSNKLLAHELGYKSYHLRVKLLDERGNLPEWTDYRDIYFEIQIRSILEHIWAEISHKYEYKIENELPRDLRRKIYLFGGLLEIADNQLKEIIANQEEMKSHVHHQLLSGNDSIPIDFVSIKEYLHESPIIKKIEQVFEESELNIIRDNNIKCIFDVSEKISFTDIRELDSEFQVVQKHLDQFCTKIIDIGGITGGRINLILITPIILMHIDLFDNDELLGYYYSQDIVDGLRQISTQLVF